MTPTYPPVEVSFQPQREEFDYRWSPSHLWSFALLAVGVLGPPGFIWQGLTHPGSSLPTTIGGAIITGVIFGGFGLYFQLQGWNERVCLRDGVIVWVNCVGKSQIRSPYGELQDLKCATVSGSSNSRSLVTLTFFTPQGQFSANSNLHHFEDLRSDMAKLITELRAARKPE